MFDRVLITPLSFLKKNTTVLGDSFLQNCSKVPSFVCLFIYILDLGIIHFYFISRTRNVYFNINDNSTRNAMSIVLLLQMMGEGGEGGRGGMG